MPDPTQHTTTTQWVASLWKLMGKEKADKYIHDLAAMKPILSNRSCLPRRESATGETPIAHHVRQVCFISSVKKARPLDYVRLGKLLGDGHYVGLDSKAPHMNAGKAFIDYFLGDESMNIMAKLGEFVNRKGVYPPLPGADKIQFVANGQLQYASTLPKRKKSTSRFS